jgi:predicted nuclease of predicted toxin-antitoxin system
MNLSPTWVSVLERAGHTAAHWSTIGAPDAPDREILEWAKTQDHVLFTHDLDIGSILAATNADAPSVIQIRTQDVAPDKAKDLLLNALKRFEKDLLRGALISLDEEKSRARLLPLR